MDPEIPPSIQLIAKKVGLSKATVSRVLRGLPGHKEATRQKIIKVADELGYSSHPIMSAVMSSVRFKKTAQFSPVIAAIHFQPWGEKRGWNMEVLRQRIHQQADNLGYKVEEFSWFDPDMKPERLMQIIRARGIRGVILEHFIQQKIHIKVDLSDLAVVSVGGGFLSPLLHRVEVNYFGGLLIALEKLRSYGYKRPGVALPTFFETMSVFKREAALYIAQQDMEEENRIPILHLEDEDKMRELEEWFKEFKPDCILGVGEGLMEKLGKMSYRFPDDIGFAHLGLQSDLKGIAGVNPNWSEIGYTAVNQVVEQLNRNAFGIPEHPMRILIDSTWVDGDSVAMINKA